MEALHRSIEERSLYWRTRAKVRYVLEGDENTKFFHSIATERHRKNSISSLQAPDGTCVTEHSDKEKIIYETYKQRLGTCSTPVMQFDLEALIEPTIGLHDLSSPFTKEEIDEVIKQMPATISKILLAHNKGGCLSVML
jgi:hypothetical protein